MPRRDAVGALHLVRRIETIAARRSLVEAQERAQGAQAVSARLLEAIVSEARAAPAADFAAWLPAARAMLAAAYADYEAAEVEVRRAFEAISVSRRAERSVADEVARRVQVDRAERLAAEQKLLEDIARATVQERRK